MLWTGLTRTDDRKWPPRDSYSRRPTLRVYWRLRRILRARGYTEKQTAFAPPPRSSAVGAHVFIAFNNPFLGQRRAGFRRKRSLKTRTAFSPCRDGPCHAYEILKRAPVRFHAFAVGSYGRVFFHAVARASSTRTFFTCSDRRTSLKQHRCACAEYDASLYVMYFPCFRVLKSIEMCRIYNVRSKT